MLGCECCAIVDGLSQQGLLHRVGRHWTLNANINSGARPSLVLQTREHRPDLGHLDADGARELGELLGVVVPRLEALSGAAKVYVLFLNETMPSHVHVHLVPRFEGEAKARDPRELIAAELPAGERTLDKQQLASEAARGLDRKDEPSALVRGTVASLSRVERAAAYSWLFRLPAFRQLSRTGRAEFYVFFWLVLLAAAMWVAGQGVVWAWVGGVVATYRLVDLVAMHLLTLLHRSRQRLASFQRSLLLAIGNLGELALITAVYVRALTDKPTPTSLLHGFDVVTLRGGSGEPGWAVDLVGVVGAGVALIVLTGVLSLVVGLISQSYLETGD